MKNYNLILSELNQLLETTENKLNELKELNKTNKEFQFVLKYIDLMKDLKIKTLLILQEADDNKIIYNELINEMPSVSDYNIFYSRCKYLIQLQIEHINKFKIED